jgi:hypothetical protein
LELCRAIDGEDSPLFSACSEGVFMIIYQPLGPDQEALVDGLAPSLEEVDSFCSSYSGVALRSCHNEAFPTLQGKILDQKYVDDFCSYSNDPDTQYTCFETLYMTAAQIYLDENNEESMSEYVEYCSQATANKIEDCINQGAVKVLQQDLSLLNKAIDICSAAKRLGLEDSCMYNISVYFPNTYFVNKFSVREEYCANLPDVWREKCLDLKIQSYEI